MDFVIGFFIAVVIALTGVGAGVITAPLLILFLNVPVDIAVSTALAYSAIVKLIVVPVQVARRQVDYRVLGFMLLGGLPGVIIGSIAFKHVAANGPRSALYFVLGAIILFTSGWHIFRHFKPAGLIRPSQDRRQDRSQDRIQDRSQDRSQNHRPDRSWLVGAIMLPIGAEVGFSSSGAGALGTVALLGMTSLSAARVVGTDLAFGLVIALAGSGIHMIGGHYDGPLLVRLATGGVAGGLAGTFAAPKIPNRSLRLALSLWLTVIGIQFCYQAATR